MSRRVESDASVILSTEIVERTAIVLLRFPCLDYFSNVRIGEVCVGSDSASPTTTSSSATKATIADPKEKKMPSGEARKRPRTVVDTDSTPLSGRGLRDDQALSATAYAFDPSTVLKFVDGTLGTDRPRLRMVCQAVGQDLHPAEIGSAAEVHEYEGAWIDPLEFANASCTRSNMAVVQLVPEATGGCVVGVQDCSRPATLASHPAEGRTADEVLVRPRVRGVQRSSMLEVTPSGLRHVPRWRYGAVLVPDAVLEMRRVK
jgi:hypothetical protein